VKGTIPVTVNLGETMSAIIFRDGIRRVGTVYHQRFVIMNTNMPLHRVLRTRKLFCWPASNCATHINYVWDYLLLLSVVIAFIFCRFLLQTAGFCEIFSTRRKVVETFRDDSRHRSSGIHFHFVSFIPVIFHLLFSTLATGVHACAFTGFA